MAIPAYGATPLSITFLGVRALQFISMIVILGLTSNFVNSMVTNSFNPPSAVVGTLTIASMATLYTLVSISFYWAEANIGLYVMAGIDGCLTLAWIIIAVVVGKPVSYLNCYKAGSSGNGEILVSLLNSLNKDGSSLSLADWSGLNKSNCFETKAIWGFGIILAILFATSTTLLPTLHYKHAKLGGYLKSAV